MKPIVKKISLFQQKLVGVHFTDSDKVELLNPEVFVAN